MLAANSCISTEDGAAANCQQQTVFCLDIVLPTAAAALGTSPDWLLSKKVAAVRYISARAPDRKKIKGLMARMQNSL